MRGITLIVSTHTSNCTIGHEVIGRNLVLHCWFQIRMKTSQQC